MHKKRTTALGLALILIVLVAGVAWAATSANHTISWWTVSSGGGPAEVTAGNVSLRGTMGQSVIGVSTSASGNQVLKAGYLSAMGSPIQQSPRDGDVFLPMVRKSP